MNELPINENTFVIVAMHHYDNTQCTGLSEFEEDLKRFVYLKKLFGRYKDNGELKERLILNHLITLYNLFGIVTTELLFFKIDKQYWDILATFLVFLNKMPDQVPEFAIRLADLNLDQKVIDALRNI
jgi:hypothetical protein